MGSAKEELIAGKWLERGFFAGILLQLVAMVAFVALLLVGAKLTEAALIGAGVALIGLVLIMGTVSLAGAWNGWVHAYATLMTFGSVGGGFSFILATGMWWVGLAAFIVFFVIGFTGLWLHVQMREVQ